MKFSNTKVVELIEFGLNFIKKSPNDHRNDDFD